jgi:hypothetical protein
VLPTKISFFIDTINAIQKITVPPSTHAHMCIEFFHQLIFAFQNNRHRVAREMANDQLKVLFKKCRCCLQNAKENERLEIGEIIREKFFEVTQFSLSYSCELSTVICSTCFSILSQYSAIKKGFIEHQNVLQDLLKRKKRSEVYVKVEVIGEQHHSESKSENQKKKIESLYRVEEAADEIQKIEHDMVESKEIEP